MFLIRLLVTSAIAGVGLIARAQSGPSSVNTGAGGTSAFQGVVLSGQTARSSQGSITVNLVNSCFGTNLRSVSNPVSPDANITMNISFVDSGSVKNYSVTYPGSTVTRTAGSISAIPLTVSGGASASYAGNIIRLVIPISMTTKVDEYGNITNDFDTKLKQVSFEQSGSTNSQYSEYVGLNGPLSGSVYTKVSKDGLQYSIEAHFPGEVGFCGGYFSPLMVFFDAKRPKFSASVNFPLNPSGKTMWPEAGAPGAFIAYDRNGDKKITTADELFGNEDGKHKNGFEALREFDSNKDGVIDGNDKDFARLLLWFDRNGDGISQNGELVPLQSRIQSISLKYDASTTGSFGTRAEVRERSLFTFVKDGKLMEGEVIDLWFSP